MGLSNFPSPAEGVLPVLVMNTVLSVALLKNMVRSVLQVMGRGTRIEEDPSSEGCPPMSENTGARSVSITQFKSLCDNSSNLARTSSGNSRSSMECCVCLCRFEADEEVSELSCKHFFHKGCLEKWFDSQHTTTCPLCRSIL
uniref:RING-type domain-containing protein n=1 Tax=Davidia involucrata TaxID=16924 RepID=A0A5B7C334_DAVIN